MTSTQTPTDLVLRLICAAGFIHGRATCPQDGLGGHFIPRPWGHDFHGATGGRDYRAAKAGAFGEVLDHLGSADAVESAWDPRTRAFVPARNQWIAVACRAVAGTITAVDETLIARKLDTCLTNAAAAKANR